MTLVELSHVIEDGQVTYPGLPAPRVTDYLTRAESRTRYAEGTEFHIGRIDMIANTGTYLDAPNHRFEGAPDIAALPLAAVAALPGVLVDASEQSRVVDVDQFDGVDVTGRAVLVRTGWDRLWATPEYGVDSPFVTAAAATALAARGAALVGIDSLNIDDAADGTRPAHTALLHAGIPIVEHLCGLEQLAGAAFTFFAVPVRVRGMGTFPVRAFATIDR